MPLKPYSLEEISVPKGTVDGPFGSNLLASEYTSSGVPLIRGVNLSLGKERFKDENLMFVSEHTADRLKRCNCLPNDIIFTKKGTLGQTGIIPDNLSFDRFLISGNQMRIRIDKHKAEALYVYYFVSSQYGQARIIADAMTAGVPKINLTYLRRFQILLPSRHEQKKIAAILTAYDDLIETNKRRIALLEKMAEELYREWFVRMRFPGYKNTKFVKGVPEGWPLERFTNLVEMNPRESINKSDPVPYVGMENLSQNSMHFVSNEKRTGVSGSKFRNRDSLLPRITPCLENGKRGFVTCLNDEQVGVGSTEFIVFREKDLPAEYIYLLTCNPSFRQHAELSMTGASGRQRVQHDCFDYFFIPKPPQEIRDRFVEIAGPLFESISQFSAQNTVLTQTRDLLLPRLISGKLSVEDLDIQFPPSMQAEPQSENTES